MRTSVPVHGERRHTLEHALYAKSLQVPEAVSPRNGEMVQLAPGEAKVIDVVPNGRLMLDGAHLVPEEAIGLSERRRLAQYGYLHVSVTIDDGGRGVDGPRVGARGLSEPDGRAADESLAALDEAGVSADQIAGIGVGDGQ